MMQNIEEYIESIYCNSEIIKNDNNHITELKNEISNCEEKIKSLLKDNSAIELFIATKLQEAIDEYDLNKNKEDNQFNETKTTWSSVGDDGEYKTGEDVYKTVNPNSKFNPFEDKWEIVSIEYKFGKYKIKVENIKGRKFMNPFMWEPDYFETDWF